jgi:hypothetical protein
VLTEEEKEVKVRAIDDSGWKNPRNGKTRDPPILFLRYDQFFSFPFTWKPSSAKIRFTFIRFKKCLDLYLGKGKKTYEKEDYLFQPRMLAVQFMIGGKGYLETLSLFCLANS